MTYETQHIPTIAEDKSPITNLTTIGGQWHVGVGGVTSILQYYENGETAKVSWFAIYRGDKIIARINGSAVETVFYEDGYILFNIT